MANNVYTIKPKRTTLSEYSGSEKVLELGEVLFVYPDEGVGKGPILIVCGDGETPVKDLPVAVDGKMIETLETWKSNQEKKIESIEIGNTSRDSKIKNLESTQSAQATAISNINKKDKTQDEEIDNLKDTVVNANKIDDVTVGGVSVVKDKVAEIPAIPSVDGFVSYEGATKDVNIGNHSLVVATTKQKTLTTRTESYNLNANIGTGTLDYPGVSIEVKKDEIYPNTDNPYTQTTKMTMIPGEFAVANTTETSSGIRTSRWVSASKDGFKVSTDSGYVLITDTAVKELADPVDGRDAANKKYVDESIAAIPEVDTSGLVPYNGATKDISLGDHAINFNTTGSVGDLSGSAIINVGKFAGGTGSTPGVYIETDAQDAGSSLSDNLTLRVDPTGISVDANHEGDTGGSNTVYSVGADGLSIQSGLDTKLKITADKVTGLALPTADTDAASKKYVDNTVKNATTETTIDVIFTNNAWTETSENSGIYTQTVTNSNIKSSSNPLLISRLSSSATIAEQSAYMKNFAIISQGVGSTSDGSVTFKVFKKPTADITVGLRGC